nr:GNAT family protein [uncultured Anaerotignum sp.]
MLTLKPTPDYDAILHWNENKDEAYLFQWAGTAAYRYPLTKEQLMRQSAKEGVTVFMAYENETPIGTMELCDIDPIRKSGRICRVLFAEEARGRGLAHAALLALCEKAFTELGLETLSLRVYCFNVPAIHCYERLGFLVTEYFEEADSHWNNYAMERKK